MTVEPSVLRAESFTEIGLLIKSDVTAITQRWEQQAVREQPHARRVHHRELLDHLPQFLDELGSSLATGGNGQVAFHRQPAATHGKQRWDDGWSLGEVVRDYQILRLVLIDYLESALDRPLASLEVRAIGLALDEAIADSVATYVSSQTKYASLLEQERATRAKDAAETIRRFAEQLQEAHRNKDEFLAVLSHELRNPLAPIRNALHVLGLDVRPETVAWARGLMDRQLRVLTRLVDDLLDVSRVARGKIVLHREKIDLTRLVRDTAEDRRGSLTEAGLQLVVETPPAPVWVEGEATRLAQVLGNLLHNAQKFTDRGGQITVSMSFPRPDQVRVAVRDTGVGIPAGLLDRVFDAYTQGDNGAQRRAGGLGLGLALVKGLVELHGGGVEAASDGEGQGAEFAFVLPVAASGPQAAPAAAPAVPQHLNILLVEDNRDNADSLQALLLLTGHRVTVTFSGPEALAAGGRSLPDVVLCDLGLPGMSGYDVAQAFRADPRTSEVHLIALSGHGSEADQMRCLEVGFEHHLSKPVDPVVLQAVLARLVKGGGEA
jgi:signal transduction histidine kinase/ActR/RegA family two-component response regulator